MADPNFQYGKKVYTGPAQAGAIPGPAQPRYGMPLNPAGAPGMLYQQSTNPPWYPGHQQSAYPPQPPAYPLQPPAYQPSVYPLQQSSPYQPAVQPQYQQPAYQYQPPAMPQNPAQHYPLQQYPPQQLPQYPPNQYVPAPTIKVFGQAAPAPMPNLAPRPVPIAPVNYAQQIPREPAAPVKPVNKLQCNGCQTDVPEFDFYKGCFDPNHRICNDCVYRAYFASDNPHCPFQGCEREYTDGELAEIHQLLLYHPQYSTQVGPTPKIQGAGIMVECVFGHRTNKTNIIPNACELGHLVCRMHYTSPACVCGRVLGAALNGDLSPFLQEQ